MDATVTAAGRPGPGSTALLSVEGLTKRFGGFTAVNDVTFRVPEGVVFGIAGPNGAGKSVLFSTVSGFYRPTAGTVEFAGRNIVGRRPHDVCRLGLTRTFQNPILFHSMTVEENLRVGASFGNTAQEDPVPELIDALDLGEVANSTATNLDLFTTKKVVLGSALATDPSLLLLDEPMAGFSHSEVEQYRALIEQIRTERAITVIIIEHLLDVMIDICDRMLILHYGEVLFEGDPSEVREHPDVIEVYLGSQVKGMDE